MASPKSSRSNLSLAKLVYAAKVTFVLQKQTHGKGIVGKPIERVHLY
jgi:hypothetical protein